MILVDTSIWIDHLRAGNEELEAALERREVLIHPFVIGELACGNLADRRVTLSTLQKLPPAAVATNIEAMLFLEGRKLMARGVGYVDVHLLASTALSSEARFWTRDTRLNEVARELRLAYEPY